LYFSILAKIFILQATIIKNYRPTILALLILLSAYPCFANPDAEKTRVIVLTDIENEPDDAQSLVRFLTYSNMFDVEGIIATTSVWLRDTTAKW
jgi:hypothetical protein